MSIGVVSMDVQVKYHFLNGSKMKMTGRNAMIHVSLSLC